MRRVALLGLLLFLASQAFAHEKVTADQLAARIASLQKSKDKKAADKLRDLELTERFDPSRLATLLPTLPGEESRAALSALADESAILTPPPAQIPSSPAPSAQELQRISAALLANAEHPDVPKVMFDATRTISRYRNIKFSWGGHSEAIPIVTPLPLRMSQSAETLSYREGQTTISNQVTHARFSEHVDNSAEDWDGARGLLKDLAADLKQVQPQWLRWELEGSTNLAVLRFNIPQEHSTLALRRIVPGSVAGNWTDHPAYICEVTIDPATGQIRRFVIRSTPDAKKLARADIAVEFTPVAVAGGALLPARAILYSNAETWVGNRGGYTTTLDWSTLTYQHEELDHIAEVVFSNYRPADTTEKPLALPDRRAVWAMLNAKRTRITLDELQQLLSKRANDSDLAEQLRSVELTQRLDQQLYAHLAAQLPGRSSLIALTTLRDLSDFEDPAATDIPAGKHLDPTQQGAILHSAVEFVAGVARKLPDMFATRTLTRYEDLFAVRGIVNPAVAINKPFGLIDQSQGTIKVRGDKEVVEPAKQPHPQASRGLDTWGGFGPMLETVMADILHAKIGWSRWESGPTGPLAVFRYAVPEPAAHYDVRFCCYMSQDGVPGQYSATPAYHGEIAIDPHTGAILRLVIRSELKGDITPFDQGAPAPLKRSDVLIEYAPVQIGGQQYICPTRMVSVMTFWTLGLNGPLKKFVDPDVSKRNAQKAMLELEHSRVTAINEAAFTDYHVFRSDMRIISDTADQPK